MLGCSDISLGSLVLTGIYPNALPAAAVALIVMLRSVAPICQSIAPRARSHIGSIARLFWNGKSSIAKIIQMPLSCANSAGAGKIRTRTEPII
jgi:hypothetical protein